MIQGIFALILLVFVVIPVASWLVLPLLAALWVVFTGIFTGISTLLAPLFQWWVPLVIIGVPCVVLPMMPSASKKAEEDAEAESQRALEAQEAARARIAAMKAFTHS